jgi:hypothetical protein
LNKMDFTYVCMSWILYKIIYYTYVLNICMVLSTWLHTKLLYAGLDNVFAFPNLQTPSFSTPNIQTKIETTKPTIWQNIEGLARQWRCQNTTSH